VADIEFGGGVTTIATTTGLQKPGEVDVSAPIKIGGRAAAPAPPPAAAIPGTIVDAYFDLQGRLVVRIDTPLPAGANEIGGVNISRIGGVAPAVDAGNTNVGTQRVVIATNDPNLSTLVSRTDIARSALRDALIGTGSKNFTTLEAVAEEILSQIEGSGGDIESLKTTVESVGAVVESIDATTTSKLDISQSELRDELITAICGADTKDFSTLQTATDAIKTASETSATSLGNLDVLLSSRASESTLGAINTAVGGLALESGGNLAALKSTVDSMSTTIGSIDTAVGSIGVTLTAISSQLDISQSELKNELVDAINASRPTPVVTAGTGDEAIAVSYAPGKSFWLDAVTVHFSAAPTTAGDLTVTLDAGDGAAYDTVLFRVDPSVDGGATDIVFTPTVPILCVEGDAIAVAYANTDGVTYGTRIVAREI